MTTLKFGWLTQAEDYLIQNGYRPDGDFGWKHPNGRTAAIFIAGNAEEYEVTETPASMQGALKSTLRGIIEPGETLGDWQRRPERDRRIERGDDHAADAWINIQTGQHRYTAVGQHPVPLYADLTTPIAESIRQHDIANKICETEHDRETRLNNLGDEE